MFALSVFLKDQLIARSTFAGPEVRIGRTSDNDIQLDNLGVSRSHARIAVAGGVHVLEELGAKNGTWVNGERLRDRRGLNDGDRIAIAKFLLIYRGAHARSGALRPRDERLHARAGETAVIPPSSEARERSGALIAHVELPGAEGEPPRRHIIARDLTLVGSGPGCDVLLDARIAPPRAFAIVRGGTWFSALALAPGVKLNRAPLDGRAVLASRDELTVQGARLRFLVAPRSAP